MPYTTRPSLLEKLKNGDETAWDEFYFRYAPFIRAVARETGLDASEGDELLQETMISIFRQKSIFRYDSGQSKFRNYLAGIVRKKIYDKFRRDQPPAKIVPEEREADHFQEVFDREYHQYILQLLLDDLKEHVSPLNFQIFEYTFLRGRSPQETAEAFEVSADQVYQTRKRCLEHLRRAAAEKPLSEPGFLE